MWHWRLKSPPQNDILYQSPCFHVWETFYINICVTFLDHCVKRKKKKAGSNSSSFTEGWVEFRDKRIAKRVAASLHNTSMANKKKSRFSSDLWSIKVHRTDTHTYISFFRELILLFSKDSLIKSEFLKDWSNDAESSALQLRNKLHLKIYWNIKYLF